MKFQYPRVQFGIRLLLMLVLLAILLIFVLGDSDADKMWLTFFLFTVITGIFIVNITPMLTQHEITDEAIILRQGLLFRAIFPFGEIESVELSQAKLWAFGLFQAGAKGRIILASGNSNNVEITLKEKKRFGLLLWRSSREIIIDLNRPADFLKLAKEKLNR